MQKTLNGFSKKRPLTMYSGIDLKTINDPKQFDRSSKMESIDDHISNLK